MDPCLPGVSIADARTIARVKLGVPSQYVNKMSVAQVCKAMHLSRKTNIMPPMEYRTYKGKTYLIDPKSPLSISDFVTFLQAKSVGEIAPVARKLKLVTEYVSKKELKTNIIKILQALKITEPIEIPRTMKLNKGVLVPTNGNLPSNALPANTSPNDVIPANANTSSNNANTSSNNSKNNANSNSKLNLNPTPSELLFKNNAPRNNRNGLNLSTNPNRGRLSESSGTNGGPPLRLGPSPSGGLLSEVSGTSTNTGPPLSLGRPSPSGGLLSEMSGTSTNSGPPLSLGRPSPSRVSEKYGSTNVNEPSLKLGARPSRGVLGTSSESNSNDNNSISNQLNSLQKTVGTNRNNHITDVVNDQVKNNSNISKTLSNLQKKIG